MKDCLRDVKVTDPKQMKKWRKEELNLSKEYHEKKQSIHNALCGKFELFKKKDYDKIIFV